MHLSIGKITFDFVLSLAFAPFLSFVFIARSLALLPFHIQTKLLVATIRFIKRQIGIFIARFERKTIAFNTRFTSAVQLDIGNGNLAAISFRCYLCLSRFSFSSSLLSSFKYKNLNGHFVRSRNNSFDDKESICNWSLANWTDFSLSLLSSSSLQFLPL